MTDSTAMLELLHTTAEDIFTGALAECRIETAFDHHIHFDGDTLRLTPLDLLEPQCISLAEYKRIFVVAIGKAALPMLDVLLSRMKRRKGLRGVCCSLEIPKKRNWRFRYFAGGHPLPNEGSFAAARAALHLLHRARKDTFIFFLISGGGSAMFDLPIDRSITLDDTIAFHDALLASGAPIAEVNTVRKHFSAVKGGRLALAAPEARKFSILLPDVPMRKLDALASSPTLPDRTTVAQTQEILSRYHLLEKFPEPVRRYFEQPILPESPGNKSWNPAAAIKRMLENRKHEVSTDARKAGATAEAQVALQEEQAGFAGSLIDTLLSSHDLVNGARARARALDFKVVIDNTCDDWDYADAARYLMQRFHELRREHPRLCLISGGEVTVTLSCTPGAGGRNQQFALACARDLAKYEGEQLVVFSAGSDGIDGNSTSAGAIADPTTWGRAISFGFNPEESLATFNACPLFTALGDAVVTGATGHNLRDLRLLLAVRE